MSLKFLKGKSGGTSGREHRDEVGLLGRRHPPCRRFAFRNRPVLQYLFGEQREPFAFGDHYSQGTLGHRENCVTPGAAKTPAKGG